MLKTLQAATLVFAVATAPALAGGFDDAQSKEIGDIVRDYLLEHPEILLEVSKKLEEKQQAEETAKREDALKALAGDIFRIEGRSRRGQSRGRRHDGRVLRLQLRLVQEGHARGPEP